MGTTTKTRTTTVETTITSFVASIPHTESTTSSKPSSPTELSTFSQTIATPQIFVTSSFESESAITTIRSSTSEHSSTHSKSSTSCSSRTTRGAPTSTPSDTSSTSTSIPVEAIIGAIAGVAILIFGLLAFIHLRRRWKMHLINPKPLLTTQSLSDNFYPSMNRNGTCTSIDSLIPEDEATSIVMVNESHTIVQDSLLTHGQRQQNPEGNAEEGGQTVPCPATPSERTPSQDHHLMDDLSLGFIPLSSGIDTRHSLLVPPQDSNPPIYTP